MTGRTGAGKSTLALAAAGFIPRVVRATLTGDVASTDRTDPARRGRSAGRVGIVFSTPANQLSASKSTVHEELAFGLENLGGPARRWTPDRRRDAAALGSATWPIASRSPVGRRAAARRHREHRRDGHDVLVLDEPTAQLDPAGTAGVAGLLGELAGEGNCDPGASSHDPVDPRGDGPVPCSTTAP